MSKTYSPELKPQVVLEALTSGRTDAEIARAYEVHPVTLSNWKKKLKEIGAKAFGGDNQLKEKEKKIAKLERMVGQKEVEIALLKNFLGESLPRPRRFASWISTKRNAD
jgi:transposase-like protein